MRTAEIGTIELTHSGCYNKILKDIQIGYRCMVCGLFVHKKSDKSKGDKK